MMKLLLVYRNRRSNLPDKKVQEGVAEIVGGQILELECVKWWNAGMAEGKTLGKEEGRIEEKTRVSELIRRFLAQNRIEDLTRAANDMTYQEELLQEMGL